MKRELCFYADFLRSDDDFLSFYNALYLNEFHSLLFHVGPALRDLICIFNICHAKN